MSISFQSIAQECVTFYADSALEAGMTCKVSQNDTVAPCTAGEEICGVAAGVKNGLASVILKGFVTVPFSGTAPAVGCTALAADGNGGVKTASGARKYLVTQVDNTLGTVGFFL